MPAGPRRTGGELQPGSKIKGGKVLEKHADVNKHVADSETASTGVSRREFLKLVGAAGAAVGVGAGAASLLAACGGSTTTTSAAPATTATTAGATTTTAAATSTTAGATGTSASAVATTASAEGGRDVKVGIVVPQTGIFAAFSSAVDWSLKKWDAALKDGVAAGDGKTHKIVTVVRDTQSDSNRAAQVTGDLIQNEKVDVVLSGGSPENVNPSADQCESMGLPSISSFVPWQAFYFGRGATPDKPFKWTYAQALGLEQTVLTFIDLYNTLPNNKMLAGLWPNTSDGISWTDANTGAPPMFQQGGYKLINPGLYPPGTEDFTAQITQYKKEGCQVFISATSPTDFTNFWKQALQQGFHPVACTAALAFLFPEAVYATGDIAVGCNCELVWHPTYPYKSSLSGETCQQLADDYETSSGQQWSSAIAQYARMEWFVDALKRTKNIDDKEQVLAAIASTKMVTMWGPLDFTSKPELGTDHPVVNCNRPPICGGQWVKGTKHKYEIIPVNNKFAPDVPLQGTIQPIKYAS
jgi:branched-chain amino acid transport system substrate-binding protein